MMKIKKKKTFETHCVIPTSNGILTMNQATYDYIRELERKLAEKKEEEEEFHIIYECDRKDNCERCTYPECQYTTNIEHAVNFHKVLEGFYEENRRHYDG